MRARERGRLRGKEQEREGDKEGERRREGDKVISSLNFKFLEGRKKDRQVGQMMHFMYRSDKCCIYVQVGQMAGRTNDAFYVSVGQMAGWTNDRSDK